jgi:hypothetical protein
MDNEQYVESVVEEEKQHRILLLYEDEVYTGHLEDTVEVYHHWHAEHDQDSLNKVDCQSNMLTLRR